MNPKTVNTAMKTIGQDTVEEMDKYDREKLKTTIVEANLAMQDAQEELEANKQYQALKQDMEYLSAAKKECDKRQKAKIKYAIFRMEELGAA